MKKLEVWDDNSIYNPPVLRDTKYTTKKSEYSSAYRDSSIVHCPEATVNNIYACHPYYEINIRPSKTTRKITRVYIDWLSTLSEIGGFTEITLIFVGWIYTIYNHNKLFNYLKYKLSGGKSSKSETEETDLETSSKLLE
jgi:hypothetical protein